MKKIPMTPEKIPAGLRGLAQWMEAQRKAELVLGVLVKKGVIAAADLINFSEESTRVLLEDKFWDGIKAGAKAHSSNQVAMKLADQRKAQLFVWLDQNLKKYATLDLAADAAELLKVVPLGRHQIRRHITAYCKQKNTR